MIAAYCYLMSGGSYDYQSHAIGFAQQDGYAKGPTLIGEGCWLGAKVVVLDGVSVGERAVLGAGAVVTKNIPSHTVAVGVPAKVVEALAKAD
jgi:acetyltransferase-like isoleucine patch superfamily enzyme